MEISSGGVEICATETKATSVMPNPQPMKIGYPHTCLEDDGVAVAIRTKNMVNTTNAVNVTHRSFFVIAP